MASACISLYLFITKLISMVLVFCVVFVTSASRRVNPHRFHNKLFHPAAAAVHSDHHRSRRGDCREDDWESLSFAGRIAQGDSDAIVQGRVERLMMWRNPSRSYQGTGIYTAEVTVNCVYKGWGYPDRLNISGFGETNDCVQTHVALGESYIFLLKDGWLEVRVSETNHQSGVEVVTPYSESTIRSFYPCRPPYSNTPAVSYYVEDDEDDASSSYSVDMFSPLDYASGASDDYSGLDSEPRAENICPAYDFFSFISAPLYGGEYYDYNKDGNLDYCRFLNVAVRPDQPHWLLLVLTISCSSLFEYS